MAVPSPKPYLPPIGVQFFGNAKDPDSIGLAEQLVVVVGVGVGVGVGVFQLLYKNGGTLGYQLHCDTMLMHTSLLLLSPDTP